jgi:hypothetical protein
MPMYMDIHEVQGPRRRPSEGALADMETQKKSGVESSRGFDRPIRVRAIQ